MTHYTPAARALLAVALIHVGTASLLATDYSESTAFDFSNNPSSPTRIRLSLGDNEIHGTTGREVTGGPVDRDFFTFVVPAGQQLTSISLLGGTTTAGAGGLGFIGITDSGSFGTDVPTSPAGLLGYLHYSTTQIGTDVLDDIGTGAGSRQFTAPLGPGTYAVWIQETAVASVSYGFSFHKSQISVPDGGPGAAGLAGAMGLMLWVASRSRRA